MTRIILAVLAALFTFGLGSNTYAHSHLSTSTPVDGEIVSEPLSAITLTFDGRIEQGSFLEITSAEGIVVELADLQIGKGMLTGTVAQPLINGDYDVNWSIISADGHPIEGVFSFTMNVPITEDQVEDNDVAKDESLAEQDTSVQNEVNEESSLFLMTLLILVALLVIVAGVIFFVKRKNSN